MAHDFEEILGSFFSAFGNESSAGATASVLRGCEALQSKCIARGTDLSRLLTSDLDSLPLEVWGPCSGMMFRLRRLLAEAWLTMRPDELARAYAGAPGFVHKALVDAQLFGLQAQMDEMPLVERLCARLEKQKGSAATLPPILAGMLFVPAWQMPLPLAIDYIEDFFLTDFVRYVVALPRLFWKGGDTAKQAAHVQRWTGFFNEWASRGEPENESMARRRFSVCNVVAHYADLITPYFCDDDFKELYRNRAAIIENMLRAQGAPLGYGFAPVKRSRVRLGILNSHFTPSTETYVTLPAFEHLDRSRYEIFVYALEESGNNSLEQECRKNADHFACLPFGNIAAQVQRIRADDLDILLIGNNVTSNFRNLTILSFFRCARTTCVASSSPVSTGITAIDYYLSGSYTEPDDAKEHYYEKLLMTDGPAHAFRFGHESPARTGTPSRADMGIPDEAVVYISGANFYKITPEVRLIWARVLAQVPGSVLVLYPFNPNWGNQYPTKLFMYAFSRVFHEYGIAPHRLRLNLPLPARADVVNFLKTGSVYLDSIPFSGATSLIDPLQAGIPPVTFRGRMARCRQSYAIMRCLGLEQLAVESEDDYIQLAARLGVDKDFNAGIRATLAERMLQQPKFLDARWYSREMDRMLQRIINGEAA